MKKVLIFLLALVMSVSTILTGCKGKQVQVQQEQEEGLKPGERVKLRIFIGSGKAIPSDIDMQDNKWANIYKEAFPEVDFEFICVTGNTAEKKTLMVASNDIPDMMPANQMEIINWSQQGVIQPLDNIVKKYYPNALKFMTPDDMIAGQYEGKQWALPIPASSIQNVASTYIRKDWLEKLNLKAPTTIDEFYQVLKAFTEKDPDGNGKNDTFGLGATKNLGWMQGIFALFEVNQGFWSRVDGKLVPDNIRPEMKEALAFIRKLHAEGLIDKDSVVQDFNQMGKKALQNKYGVIGYGSWGMNGTLNIDLMKSGGEYMTLEPMKGPKGKQTMWRDRNVMGNYVVSSECRYPQYPAKILNWLLEEDKSKSYYALNADRLNCGEIGRNAIVVPGNYIVLKPQGSLDTDGLNDLYRMAYRLVYGSMNLMKDDDMVKMNEGQVQAGMLTKYAVDDMKYDIKYAHYDDRIISGPVYAEYTPDLTAYFDEIKMKIVTGAEPIDSFDKWVDYFNKNNGPKIVEEINRLHPAK